MSFKNFQVKIDDGIAHVIINRPKSFNSFDRSTWEEYHKIFEYLTLKNCSVCILSGQGKHFCSGIDLKSFQSIKGLSEFESIQFIKNFQRCIAAPIEFDIPVISVAHGVNYGLALDIHSATSIRLASKDSKYSIKEIDVGIIADIGSLQRIPKIVGNISKLTELALTGRTFSCEEAKEIGLISDVYEDKEIALEKALEIAKIINEKFQPAVIGTKKHLEKLTVNDEIVQNGLNEVAVDNTRVMKHPEFDINFKRKFGKFKL